MLNPNPVGAPYTITFVQITPRCPIVGAGVPPPVFRSSSKSRAVPCIPTSRDLPRLACPDLSGGTDSRCNRGSIGAPYVVALGVTLWSEDYLYLHRHKSAPTLVDSVGATLVVVLLWSMVSLV